MYKNKKSGISEKDPISKKSWGLKETMLRRKNNIVMVMLSTPKRVRLPNERGL